MQLIIHVSLLISIYLTFDIDSNGIVSVSAKDTATGKEQSISIKSNGGLSDDEIKNMVADAEANREADKAKREMADARNSAQAAMGAAERQLEEGTDLDQALADAVSAAKDELQTLIDNADTSVEDLRAANKKLMDAAMALGQSQYAKSASATDEGTAEAA
jgi:molecular chaperone DnaK